MTDSTQGTVTNMLFPGLGSLPVIDPTLNVVVEDTNIEKPCVRATAKYILEDILLVADTRVVIQFLYLL